MSGPARSPSRTLGALGVPDAVAGGENTPFGGCVRTGEAARSRDPWERGTRRRAPVRRGRVPSGIPGALPLAASRATTHWAGGTPALGRSYRPPIQSPGPAVAWLAPRTGRPFGASPSVQCAVRRNAGQRRRGHPTVLLTAFGGAGTISCDVQPARLHDLQRRSPDQRLDPADRPGDDRRRPDDPAGPDPERRPRASGPPFKPARAVRDPGVLRGARRRGRRTALKPQSWFRSDGGSPASCGGPILRLANRPPPRRHRQRRPRFRVGFARPSGRPG